MSDDSVSSEFFPPVCNFFRAIIVESDFTEHDLSLAMRHTKVCKSCEHEIGRLIHEKIDNSAQAETSGA